MTLITALRTLSTLTPVPGWTDTPLATALEGLHTPVSATELTSIAASLVMLVVALSVLLIGLAPPVVPTQRLLVIVWAVTVACVIGLLRGPLLYWESKQARAFGAAPDLIGLAALRLHVTPASETAAAFAAEHGHGPLADSLAAHCQGARGTGKAGWEAFGTTWGGKLPELRRAVSLLAAAAAATDETRKRLLDRSLETVLTGARDRMARYATALQGPTTAVYAFGVVLPLALIGALPTVRAAGLSFGLPLLAVVYVGLLPICLILATVWLLARRPASFPAAPIPSDHPDLPNRRWRLLVVCLVIGLGGMVVSGRVFPAWTPPLITTGLVGGSALVLWFRPVVDLRD